MLIRVHVFISTVVHLEKLFLKLGTYFLLLSDNLFQNSFFFLQRKIFLFSDFLTIPSAYISAFVLSFVTFIFAIFFHIRHTTCCTSY